MKVQPIGTTKKGRRPRSEALWLCAVAGVIALALAARPGVRTGFAQTAPPQQAAAPQEAAKSAPDTSASASDERKKQIADESANLLSLANSLKAEVDKTTKDTLSVTVVREAGEIERLAHKMRAQ